MSVIYAVLGLIAFRVLSFYGLIDGGIEVISRTKATFVRMGARAEE